MLRRRLISLLFVWTAAICGLPAARSSESPDDLRKFERVRAVIHGDEQNGGREISLSFRAFNQSILVFLRLSPSSFYPNFPLHNGDGTDRRMELLRSTRFYTGRVHEWKFSRASVILGNSPNEIYAKLEGEKDVLYVEPSGDSNLVYWGSDLNDRLKESLFADQQLLPPPAPISFARESFFQQFLRSRRATEPISRNRCELKLVADYSFFKVIGNGNYANAARYLVNLIERVNAIFTEVDWGINADGRQLVNLGFVIKEMKIFDKPTNSPPSHFNSDISTREDGYFVAMDVLTSFSMLEGTKSACLTFLISGKILANSVLGLANIGRPGTHGLCAREPIGNIFANTGLVSVQRRSGLMITRVVDLVFAHEMGHSWGANHDILENPECRPVDPQSGRYIMHESSNSGYDKNNFVFSPCSMRSIHQILYDVAESCFVSEQEALCGNGILEPGEQCDPGGQLAHGRPTDHDRCCTSNCRLRAGAKCSPKHSECCSASCSYLPQTTMCQARSSQTCKSETFCRWWPERQVPGSPAGGRQHDLRGRGKVPGRRVHFSFCKIMSPLWTPCICEAVHESCLRCCRNPDTKVCMPVKGRRPLPEGAICIHGQCRQNECVKEATDAATHFWRIIKDIGANPNPKYIADYIVFIVIVVSLFIWCPCGFYILYKVCSGRRKPSLIARLSLQDRQKRQQTVAAVDYDVQIVSQPKRLRHNAKPT
ncbi:hypothetical protein M3Y99_00059200 [Aphelenchoides fujianensis]|nr:hypothetical protein M3Y99_00059200 [Aphelenchoides fujianensis]